MSTEYYSHDDLNIFSPIVTQNRSASAFAIVRRRRGADRGRSARNSESRRFERSKCNPKTRSRRPVECIITGHKSNYRPLSEALSGPRPRRARRFSGVVAPTTHHQIPIDLSLFLGRPRRCSRAISFFKRRLRGERVRLGLTSL